MKKKIIGLLLLLSLIMPFSTLAATKKYNTLNLEKALEQEEIEHDLSNYKEDDKQAVIYLFRGKGCGYCRNFLTFLNSIVDEYGKYFKVVSYEVWYDQDNGTLMQEVSDFLGANATGVPFIVIGDKYFKGYGEAYADSIKEAIMDQYNSKDKYDVMDEMAKAKKAEEKANKGTNTSVNTILIIVCNFILISAATITILMVSKQHNVLLNNKIDELETKINSMKQAEKVNVKKEDNKVKDKKKKNTKE